MVTIDDTDNKVPRRRAMRWWRWRVVAVGTVLLGAIGWLLWVPPELRGPAVLECQPIGRGGSTSMMGALSEHEVVFVDAYISKNVTFAGQMTEEWMTQTRLEIHAGAARECSAARTNRLAALILVVGVGLMWVGAEAACLVMRRLPPR